jgi:phage shock protein PspC (stress-responsive transcriptional regulator)
MAAGRAGGKAVIMNTAPYPEPETTEAADQPRQLYRPVHDRMLAGVASGIARYLGVDAMVVRVALVVLCFAGGIGVPIYVASWLLLPEESPDGGEGHSIAADFTQSMQDWRN